jgi:MFS superfamily sulfate permease-like transporter
MILKNTNKFCWLVTFLGVVLLDVDYGLYVGIGVSLFIVVVRDQFFQVRKLTEYTATNEFVNEIFVINDLTNERVCILILKHSNKLKSIL